MQENPDEAAKYIGFMPDFPPMYEDLLVWEFLDLFAASYYVPKSQRYEVIDHYLDLVGLTEKRNSFIPGLSRGMRQRLMLAKTLIPDPNVVILDEPASGMDPHGRADLKRIMIELGQRGKAVIISSHILTEMNEFCSAIGIMERGHMIVSGSIDDIRQKMGNQEHCEIRVLGKEDDLQHFLKEHPQVHSCKPMGNNKYRFHFRGDEMATSQLLAAIVKRGIPVVSFIQQQENLEDLFLKIGARQLS